ncbi:MAG: dodecin domain-containing protein [Clostridia bacterium]|nr:dodecin domain-containing protein [Clostridia bacterium]
MATEKHIKITGISTVSWKDAIVQSISEVAKTIDYINTVKILEQTAKVNGKKIVEYYVTLDLSFTVDREREE